MIHRVVDIAHEAPEYTAMGGQQIGHIAGAAEALPFATCRATTEVNFVTSLHNIA